MEEGLRVLVVEDDEACLFILERMLLSWRYRVTKCRLANEALSLLRMDKSKYDIVISDVHLTDMDGFKLLEIIGMEMDLPVVMVSSDDKQDVIMKGIIHGACDYLIKPIQRDALRLIWQHVVRKRNIQLKQLGQLRTVEDGELRLNHCNNAAENVVSADKEDSIRSKRKNVDEDREVELQTDQDTNDIKKGKKARLVWTQDLHCMFVVAVNELGSEKVVPMKILECMQKMGAPNLTRENVASHLQKYRSAVKKNNQTQSTSHIGYKEPNTEGSYALNEFNLQTRTTSGQLPQQRFTAQAARRERKNYIDHSSHFDTRGMLEIELSNSATQGCSYPSMPITVDPNRLFLIQKQQEEASTCGRNFGFRKLPLALQPGVNYSTNLINTGAFTNQPPMVNGNTGQVMTSGFIASPPQVVPNYDISQVVDQNVGGTRAMDSNIATTCYPPANELSKHCFLPQRSTCADIYGNLGSAGNVSNLPEDQDSRIFGDVDEFCRISFLENLSDVDPRNSSFLMSLEHPDRDT